MRLVAAAMAVTVTVEDPPHPLFSLETFFCPVLLMDLSTPTLPPLPPVLF